MDHGKAPLKLYQVYLIAGSDDHDLRNANRSLATVPVMVGLMSKINSAYRESMGPCTSFYK